MTNKLTTEQEKEICWIIGEWYMQWKHKICDAGTQHRLGHAKEQLKEMICSITDNEKTEHETNQKAIQQILIVLTCYKQAVVDQKNMIDEMFETLLLFHDKKIAEWKSKLDGVKDAPVDTGE
jgi:hypothetical protein